MRVFSRHLCVRYWTSELWAFKLEILERRRRWQFKEVGDVSRGCPSAVRRWTLHPPGRQSLQGRSKNEKHLMRKKVKHPVMVLTRKSRNQQSAG